MTVVSVSPCYSYELEAVRQSLSEALHSLGGMEKFIRPGMKVLVKPNLLSAAGPEAAVITHPAVIQAVVEQVRAAGGVAWIGDSPAGPVETTHQIWRDAGIEMIAKQTGAELVLFDDVIWKQVNGLDYFVARPVLEADFIIDVPKLKTYMLTLYTGAVKNLFGVIPGNRKREYHLRAPGVQDFSSELVNLYSLVRPGLVIMDGVLGQEGEGPGMRGTPRRYNLLAASPDGVALDAVVAGAMGYHGGEVLHIAEAGQRLLGESNLGRITVRGDKALLDFGKVKLPRPHWYFRVPSWLSAPLARSARLRPALDKDRCTGCGRCGQICP